MRGGKPLSVLNLNLERLIYVIPAIILALSMHEYAHARISYAFGDPTARDAGRLTLNPLRHLDIVGTLLLIFAGFGWAKPVPINPYYYQGNRRKKVMWVALAGPVSNLLQALLAAVILSLLMHFTTALDDGFGNWLCMLMLYYVNINLVLAVFNLLPVPPLDGSKILAGILPERYSHIIYNLEQYGFIILLALVFFGLVGKIIMPLAGFLFTALMRLVFLV